MAHVPRLYVPGAASGGDAPLPEGTEHHLLRVLRLRPGTRVFVFDGAGREYAGRLEQPGRELRVRVGDLERAEPPAALAVTLVVALSRRTRMEWTLEKAVELGAAAIRPVFSERARIRLDASRAARKLAHWRSLVIAAAAQSGRARLPVLREPVALDEALQDTEAATRLLLDPGADAGLGDMAAPDRELALLAGPESGFSESERSAAEGAGWRPVRLGPRVLRAETAGPAALAAAQALWGDMR